LIPCENEKATTPAELTGIFQAILASEHEIDRRKEHIWAVGFSTKLMIEYIELVSLGTLDHALAHPREIFRMAILKGVSRIAMVHNHPSGDPSPSRADLALFKQLEKAGEIIGIQMVDSLIIGTSGHKYWSWHENEASSTGPKR